MKNRKLKTLTVVLFVFVFVFSFAACKKDEVKSDPVNKNNSVEETSTEPGSEYSNFLIPDVTLVEPTYEQSYIVPPYENNTQIVTSVNGETQNTNKPVSPQNKAEAGAVAESYVNAMNTQNTDAILDLQSTLSKSKMTPEKQEEFVKEIEDSFAQLKAFKGVKISAEAVSVEAADTLYIQEEYNNAGLNNITITEAYYVTVDITMSILGYEDVTDSTFTIIRENSEWKIYE